MESSSSSGPTNVIILEGNIGTNKRQLLYKLKSKYPNYLVIGSPVVLFNKYRSYNPLTYHNKQASFDCQLYIIISLKLWYKKVFRNLHKYPVVVIVKCLEHPLVYNQVLAETGHLTCFEKEFLNDLFEQNVLNELNFPCPDGCFVISSDPATCLDTVKIRQNPHENHVTLDFGSHGQTFVKVSE